MAQFYDVLTTITKNNQSTDTFVLIGDYLKSKQWAKMLYRAINFNTHFKNAIIKLGENSNINSEIQKIVVKLLQIESIEFITLHNFDPFSSKCINLIYNAISTHKNLTTIDLQNTKFSYENFKLFMKSLKLNYSVKKLTINNCNIDDEAVILIANMLRNNNTIMELDLSHNYIQSKGLTAIGDALKKNSTLIQLDIMHNMFTYSAINTFLINLIDNNTLQILNIVTNSMNHDIIYSLPALLLKNNSLIEIHLFGQCGANVINKQIEKLVENLSIVKPQVKDIKIN